MDWLLGGRRSLWVRGRGGSELKSVFLGISPQHLHRFGGEAADCAQPRAQLSGETEDTLKSIEQRAEANTQHLSVSTRLAKSGRVQSFSLHDPLSLGSSQASQHARRLFSSVLHALCTPPGSVMRLHLNPSACVSRQPCNRSVRITPLLRQATQLLRAHSWTAGRSLAAKVEAD
jgi:hypothetical protein